MRQGPRSPRKDRSPLSCLPAGSFYCFRGRSLPCEKPRTRGGPVLIGQFFLFAAQALVKHELRTTSKTAEKKQDDERNGVIHRSLQRHGKPDDLGHAMNGSHEPVLQKRTNSCWRGLHRGSRRVLPTSCLGKHVVWHQNAPNTMSPSRDAQVKRQASLPSKRAMSTGVPNQGSERACLILPPKSVCKSKHNRKEKHHVVAQTISTENALLLSCRHKKTKIIVL